jgi:hypothetical protein
MQRIDLNFRLIVEMSVPEGLGEAELDAHIRTVRLALSDGIASQNRRHGLVADGATVHEVILRHVQVDKR